MLPFSGAREGQRQSGSGTDRHPFLTILSCFDSVIVDQMHDSSTNTKCLYHYRCWMVFGDASERWERKKGSTGVLSDRKAEMVSLLKAAKMQVHGACQSAQDPL